MSYKFSYPTKPANWADVTGLKYRAYSVYSGSESDSPDPASLVSGALSATEGVSTQISSFAVPDGKTYLWRGYFKPDATSTSWQFRVTSEDGAYLWLDTNAESAAASLNRSNAIVDNGGTHGSQTATSANQSLNSEFYYAITLVAGSTGGAGSATLEWRRDSGAWSSVGTNYLKYDSRFADGFGADTYEYTSTNTMSRLAIGLDDGIASWANLADVDTVTVWENNIHRIHGVETWDLFDIAYGKDGSGNAMWAAINTVSADTILHSTATNFTDKGTWTEATNVDQRMYTILWGNDVWIAAGAMTGHDKIWRSTDGSTWSSIDLSSITFDGSDVRALTSDGAGNWWFGCGSKIYKSTNDGSSWSEEATITVGASGVIRDLVYTNSTVVVLYKYDDGAGTQEARTASAAASDTTDWSSGVHLSSGGNMRYDKTNRCAAGDGRVVFIDNTTTMAADVNGKTITIQGTRQTLPDEGNANCIATDGAGTWWVGSDGGTTGADGGDICRSNDNGLSWTRTVHGIRDFANHKVESIATDQYLPL